MGFLSFSTIIAAVLLRCIAAQPGLAPRAEANKGCRITLPGLMIPCPEGWSILDHSDREVVISTKLLFAPEPTKNTRSRGKATISIAPKLYRTLSEWIFAGHKNAPDAVETTFRSPGSAGIDVSVVCLASPQSPGLLYASYFFQVGKTPVLIELNYRAEDPNREEYTAAALRMITTAIASR